MPTKVYAFQVFSIGAENIPFGTITIESTTLEKAEEACKFMLDLECVDFSLLNVTETKR